MYKNNYCSKICCCLVDLKKDSKIEKLKKNNSNDLSSLKMTYQLSSILTEKKS